MADTEIRSRHHFVEKPFIALKWVSVAEGSSAVQGKKSIIDIEVNYHEEVVIKTRFSACSFPPIFFTFSHCLIFSCPSINLTAP